MLVIIDQELAGLWAKDGLSLIAYRHYVQLDDQGGVIGQDTGSRGDSDPDDMCDTLDVSLSTLTLKSYTCCMRRVTPPYLPLHKATSLELSHVGT